MLALQRMPPVRSNLPVERTSGGSNLIEVLDRVLDKGIVIDAWVRVSMVGIDLIAVHARIVVASIETGLAELGAGLLLNEHGGDPLAVVGPNGDELDLHVEPGGAAFE
jgi:hypothetical protein